MTHLSTSGLAIALYLLTAFFLLRRLSLGAAALNIPKIPYVALGLGGAILHAGILYLNIFTISGVNLGLFNALSLTFWLISVLILLTALSKPVENLAIITLPLAALAISLELVFPGEHMFLQNAPGIGIHVLLSLLAYSLLGIAAVQAVLLAVQDHQLHHKHPGGFIRALPPLAVMETLLFQVIGIGFLFLSAALISGMVFLEDIFAQHLVHKTVLSFTAWGVFAVLLWGRWHFGWRGRRAILWTLGGFFFLLLSYVGSKLVLEIILRR
jgi:ABC-type uncharacterized transport system permease subunit